MAVPSTDWQLGCMQLKQRGAHLLQTGQWADCVFMVGAPPRQVTVTAHKLILASASPVFEAMFFGGMAERDGPIPILDVHPDAFKALLQYIYTDKAELGSFEMACSIYYGAKKYMLPYLEKECTWFISLNLRPKNVCRAYELGQLFDETLLMEKCLKVMENQTKEVVNAASFLDADLSTINKILSLESLNIESELDLFRALEKYAKVHMKGNFYKRPSLSFSDSIRSSPPKKIKMDNSDAEKTQNITNFVEQIDKPMGLPVKSETVKDVPNSETGEVSIKMSESYCEKQTSLDTYNDESMNNSQESLELSSLRSAIGKVRFLTMSPAAFAAGPARSPLLSEPQCFALLMHIVSTDSDVPMPEGFSTSRVARNQPYTLLRSAPRSPLLSEPQCFALLMHIVSTDSDVPMPEGFSTSRVARNQQNLMPEESSSKSEAVFRFTVLNFKTRRRSVESRPFHFHELPWSIIATNCFLALAQNLMPEESSSKSEAVFRFTVLNFKTRRRSVESRPFHFHELPWSIKMVPRFENTTSFSESKFFGLYLRCEGIKDSQWAVSVRAELRLVAQAPRARNIAMQIHKTFTNKENEWGFNRFVNWTDVMDSERGFLRGNAIEIEAHLVADAASGPAHSLPGPAHSLPGPAPTLNPAPPVTTP